MNVMMYDKRLVLVLKEDDDIGYARGCSSDVTTMLYFLIELI